MLLDIGDRMAGFPQLRNGVAGRCSRWMPAAQSPTGASDLQVLSSRPPPAIPMAPGWTSASTRLDFNNPPQTGALATPASRLRQSPARAISTAPAWGLV